MIYFGVVLGLIIMAVMIYMALDKHSTSATRIASLIALGVMVLTIIICLFIIFTDKTVPVDESILIVGAPAETKKDGGSSIWLLLLFVIILLGLFGIIAFITMKENKKHIQKSKDIKIEISDDFDL